MPTDKPKYAAVLGHPVSHSLSPRLHNYWLKEREIAGEYTAIETSIPNLSNQLQELKEKGFVGVNLTVPLKIKGFELLEDNVDITAKRLGAINTVVFCDDTMRGYNTDAYGFIRNLTAHGIKLKGMSALVLGGGGGARAACVGLLDAGVKVTITNRTRERAEAIQQAIAANQGSLPKGSWLARTNLKDFVQSLNSPDVDILDWEKIPEAMRGKSLFVNATAGGMKANEPLNISLENLPRAAVVTDIVYNPLETPLLKQAKEHGNKTVDGLGMLLYQAQEAFKLWFGEEPEVTDKLRAYVLEGLA